MSCRASLFPHPTIEHHCVPAGAEPASHVEPSQRIRLRPLQEAAQAAAGQSVQWQHPAEPNQILGIEPNDSSTGAPALSATSLLQPLPSSTQSCHASKLAFRLQEYLTHAPVPADKQADLTNRKGKK